MCKLIIAMLSIMNPAYYTFSLRGEKLIEAIAEDKAKGLIPFCVIATLGTTACLAFDNILELGPICQNEKVYLSWS